MPEQPRAKTNSSVFRWQSHSRLPATGQHGPLLRVDTPLCHALIAINGGQLLQFAPAGQQPWLWLPPGPAAGNSSRIAGGIPLCLPWFGRPANPALPIHGYVQDRPWQLEHADCSDGQAICQLRFDNPPGEPGCPQAFTVRQRFVLGDTLRIELQLDNTGDRPLSLSWAWHSYFRLDDADARISGLQQLPYLDNLAGLQVKKHYADWPASQPCDAVFENTRQPQQLQQQGRQLTIRGDNCPTCIVWQPGINNQQRFVCIERGRAFADQLQLAAGQRWQAGMTIEQRTGKPH